MAGARARNFRWYVCGLLFFATTINYVDRQVLGLLKPVLEKELGWSEADYGWIIFAFQAAYGLMMPLAGRLIDWAGTRLGYAAAVAFWSLAAMAHALARGAADFRLVRFALGLSESANFPAAIKTVAGWFPQRERAMATGIFNSGANVGAILAPLAVPYLALRYGWRSAFLVTGAIGLMKAQMIAGKRPNQSAHPIGGLYIEMRIRHQAADLGQGARQGRASLQAHPLVEHQRIVPEAVMEMVKGAIAQGAFHPRQSRQPCDHAGHGGGAAVMRFRQASRSLIVCGGQVAQRRVAQGAPPSRYSVGAVFASPPHGFV